MVKISNKHVKCNFNKNQIAKKILSSLTSFLKMQQQHGFCSAGPNPYLFGESN